MSKRLFLRMYFWRMDGSFGKTLVAEAICRMKYVIRHRAPLAGHPYCFWLRGRERALAAVRYRSRARGGGYSPPASAINGAGRGIPAPTRAVAVPAFKSGRSA